MKLYNINGIELHDIDSLDSIHDDDYLYYSFSKRNALINLSLIDEPFDFSVCMEFLEL